MPLKDFLVKNGKLKIFNCIYLNGEKMNYGVLTLENLKLRFPSLMMYNVIGHKERNEKEAVLFLDI